MPCNEISFQKSITVRWEPCIVMCIECLAHHVLFGSFSFPPITDIAVLRYTMTTVLTPPRRGVQFVLEPSSVEPPRRLPRRVSHSPPCLSPPCSSMSDLLCQEEDFSPEHASAPEENQKQQVLLRRSKRERHSTVVYVGNQAIKKSNNYVLKGFSYEENSSLNVTDRPCKKQRTTLKELTSHHHHNPKPTVVLSQRERSRRERKKTIQCSIQAKQERRRFFLLQHLAELEPFCEARILQQLQQTTTSAVRASPPTTVYGQPEAITAELRDYQLEGLNWMSKMYSNNVGMILGDGTS